MHFSSCADVAASSVGPSHSQLCSATNHNLHQVVMTQNNKTVNYLQTLFKDYPPPSIFDTSSIILM